MLVTIEMNPTIGTIVWGNWHYLSTLNSRSGTRMSAAAAARCSPTDDPLPSELVEVIVKEETDFEAVEVLNTFSC